MQKQAELRTQLQQVLLPDKDKGALSFLSPETTIPHIYLQVGNNLPPKQLFGMCQPERLYRNINSNITPEIFNISYSLIHIN